MHYLLYQHDNLINLAFYFLILLCTLYNSYDIKNNYLENTWCQRSNMTFIFTVRRRLSCALHRKLGRHSAGPHQGKEAGMGVIRCPLMHWSVFADLCCNRGMAWPNLRQFSILRPPQICFTCSCHTTPVGEPIFQGGSIHPAPIPIGSLIKPCILHPMPLFSFIFFFPLNPSPLMFEMCWYFPLYFGREWVRVRGNKCHNNIPFQKNIV